MKVYGLIGYPLTHSFSQRYFSEKFQKEQITGVMYENFSLHQIEEIEQVFERPGLSGLNVTIPYKEAILPWLDELDPVVAAVGACNCIRIQNGKRKGYNTDVIGFDRSLDPHLKPHHQKALILGTGGAAKAVRFVLEKKGIRYKMVSRQSASADTLRYEDLTPEQLAEHTLIINTTPLGMYPQVDTVPPLDFTSIGSNHFLFDLIYNPATTRFLQEGKDRGATTCNGADMLLIQAEESWKIWNNLI